MRLKRRQAVTSFSKAFIFAFGRKILPSKAGFRANWISYFLKHNLKPEIHLPASCSGKREIRTNRVLSKITG